MSDGIKQHNPGEHDDDHLESLSCDDHSFIKAIMNFDFLEVSYTDFFFFLRQNLFLYLPL